jgi:hypothetical protein
MVHPDVRRMLLEAKAFVEGGQAFTLWTALQADLQHSDDAAEAQKAHDYMGLITPVLKAYLTDKGFHVASLAMQVHGGSGYTEHFTASQYLRDARITMIYEGANGNSGEIGHVRLSAEGPVGYNKAGSFEGWCSGGGLGRLAQAEARKRGGRVAFNPGRIEDITARHVAVAAESGDTLAREVLAESGRRLGMALAIIIDVLNPEVIVLGSVYSRARRWLEPHMRPVLEAEALPGSLAVCQVVPTALGEDIGNWAAIAIAVYHAGGFARDVRGAVDSALAPLAAGV